MQRPRRTQSVAAVVPAPKRPRVTKPPQLQPATTPPVQTLPGPVMGWRAVVDRLKAEAMTQPWRWSGLSKFHGWQEYVIAWQSVAQGIEPGHSPSLPNTVGGFDRRLQWAWAQVDELLDSVAMVVDSRTPHSSALCVVLFSELRGLGLIWPDGTVLPAVLSMATSNQRLADARHQMEVSEAIAKAAKAQQTITGLTPQTAPTAGQPVTP